MANTPNFNQLMEIAQQMQKGMMEVQQGLADKKITGAAGTGDIKVEVIMNGQQQVEKVVIGAGAINEGQEILADLMAAATNDAIEKVKHLTKNAMVDIYQKAGVPTDG